MLMRAVRHHECFSSAPGRRHARRFNETCRTRHMMSSVARGTEFASAVGQFLEMLGLKVEREYSAEVGIGSKGTKHHRFDFGSPEVLVECKCYGWTEGGNNPSAKI